MGRSGIPPSRQATRAFHSTGHRPVSARPRHLVRPRVSRHGRLLSSSSSASGRSSEGLAAPSSSAGTADAAVPAANEQGKAAQGAPGQGFGAKPTEPSAGSSNKAAPQQRQRPPRKPQQPKAPPRGDNLLVIGLGNPGDRFKLTRHNAGFMVAEELARRHGGTLKIKNAFQGEYCSVTVKGKSVGILRPITFMNNSGMSARKVMDFFKLPMPAALTVVDEVSLDFGQLRLKGKGSAGGHNGLKSLQTHLKTPNYTRLKVGVGAPHSALLSDYVMGEFTRTEKKELENVVSEACDAVEHWIEEEDMGKVMTRVNTR